MESHLENTSWKEIVETENHVISLKSKRVLEGICSNPFDMNLFSHYLQ